MAGKFEAVISDLDGVLTRTAGLHARAWKQMFDEYFQRRQRETDEEHRPFDIDEDYKYYVDGKPRFAGARAFLESRGIELAQGELDDSPAEETVYGLGNRKNEFFHQILKEQKPEQYDDAVAQIKSWRDEGLKTALITSSRNGAAILRATGLEELFDVTIDGVDSAKLSIDGKPAPDIFLEAARQLHVEPQKAVVLEDAISGVEAGKAGRFGLVVGVNRGARSDGAALRAHGADLVVSDVRDVDLDFSP